MAQAVVVMTIIIAVMVVIDGGVVGGRGRVHVGDGDGSERRWSVCF